MDGRALQAIDGASTRMARTHGRIPQGGRLRAAVPHARVKATAFIAGLRTTGLVATRGSCSGSSLPAERIIGSADDGARRPDRRGLVPCLCRASALSHSEARRYRHPRAPARHVLFGHAARAENARRPRFRRGSAEASGGTRHPRSSGDRGGRAPATRRSFESRAPARPSFPCWRAPP